MTEKTKSEKQLEKDAEDYEPTHEGDVLGVSDADPNVQIPRATSDRGGNPRGIDVDTRAGSDDVQRHKSGAVGVDLGGAGKPDRESPR